LSVIAASLFGFLFGIGLIVAKMTDPARIIAFLDFAGAWDPTLAFVMIGAIVVAAPAFALARRRKLAPLGNRIVLPDRSLIDRRLLGGAALFGIGWGLCGICPGPSLVLLGSGNDAAAIFVVMIIIGSHIVAGVDRRKPTLLSS
jgi:uncharacterized membrane protein YedE/YeeE